MAKTPLRGIRVPDARWEAALRVTSANGTNVSKVVNQALQEYIDEHEDQEPGPGSE